MIILLILQNTKAKQIRYVIIGREVMPSQYLTILSQLIILTTLSAITHQTLTTHYQMNI